MTNEEDYLKYNGRVPEPPYDTQPRPSITEAKVREIVYQHMDGGYGCPSNEYYNCMKVAWHLLREAGVTVEEKP